MPKTSFWAYNKKYQPSTIDELALYPALNLRLRKYAHTQHFPNLIMYGKAGTGKTTAARILASSVKNTTTDIFDFGRDPSVNNVRRLITMTERYTLFGNRIFILDEWHDVDEK